MGLAMKHSNACKKKNADFEKWVGGILGEHVPNPEKRKRYHFAIRVGGRSLSS